MLWAKSPRRKISLHIQTLKKKKPCQKRKQHIVISYNQILKSRQKGELSTECTSFLCNKKFYFFFKSVKRFYLTFPPLFFFDKESLHNPGQHETHYIDQAGFKLLMLIQSFYQVLGLQAQVKQAAFNSARSSFGRLRNTNLNITCLCLNMPVLVIKIF